MNKRVKKLVLNRETLRALAGHELPKVQGGASFRSCEETRCTCISFCYQCITDEPSFCIC